MKKINAWSNDVSYQTKRKAQNYISSNVAKKKINRSLDSNRVSPPCTGSCGCGSSCGD